MPTLIEWGLNISPGKSELDLTDRRARDTEPISGLSQRFLAAKIADDASPFGGQLRSGPPPDVDGPRHWLHVIGIDAVPLPTEMIEFKPFWDRTLSQFVRNAMNTHIFPTMLGDCVPSASDSTDPQPTPGHVIHDVAIRRHGPPDSVMTKDEPAGLSLHIAIAESRLRRNGRSLPTTTLTEPKRDGSIILHLGGPFAEVSRPGCNSTAGHSISTIIPHSPRLEAIYADTC